MEKKRNLRLQNNRELNKK